MSKFEVLMRKWDMRVLKYYAMKHEMVTKWENGKVLGYDRGLRGWVVLWNGLEY
jgi:hypothetical protein